MTLTPMIVFMFILSLVGQFIGIALIPATRGFTAPLTTAGCTVGFMLSVALSARMMHKGAQLSVLTPLTTVAIQLCAIAVGILIYKESASVAKIAMLLVACALVGLASAV